ncbi:MAG: anti-sigma factor [Thermonemataceae bacterium]|nr:anti-sigma factor [Thermonemataceae bacterium]
MNIQEFIESGILSVYVLGVASEEEQQQVEKMANLYPEIQEELSVLQAAMSEYVAQYEVPPPASLKNKVMKAVEVQESGRIPADYKKSTWYYGLAASIALLFGSMIANFYLYQEWKNSEEKIATLETQQSLMAQTQQKLESKYTKLTEELSIVQNPDFQLTYLVGLQETAPQSYAAVFWNEKSQTAYIYTSSLPKPPFGKQYQLWALVEKDETVWDAGVFDWGKFSPVKCFKKPEKFIITLEKEGGVPKAEGKAYAIGTVKS